MNIWGNCKRFWFQLGTHRYDGWHIFRDQDFIIVRLGWCYFGFGRYLNNNTDCYKIDRITKIYDEKI